MNVLTKFANTSAAQKAVKWASANNGKNLATLKKHLPGLMGVWMTSFYAVNNLKSDKIPRERKIPLLINDMICCAFGTGGGYLLSSGIFRFKDALMKRFSEVVKTNAKSPVLMKGMSSIVPLLAFTFMFRYIGPVFAVPLADKITKGLIKAGVIKDPEKVAEQKKVQDQVALAGAKISESKTAGKNFDYTIVGEMQQANQAPHKFDPNFETFLNKVGFKAQGTFIV